MTWTLEAEHPFGAGAVVKRYRLGSGLGLILCRDAGAPIVTYQTWYRVGSRHELPGATGMAHLFEHLMFNQTESLPPGELDRLIERVGGETNAATWVDWTFYTTSVPAHELALAARIEADRMQHLVLTDDVLAAEREVVAAERLERVDDDIDGFLSEQLFALAFRDHPYHWPTIGWMDDIRGAEREQVLRFYRGYYAPNNATVVMVGDIDETEALAIVAQAYADIPPSEVAPDAAAAEPAQDAERLLSFAKPVPAERALLGYKSPPQGHPDWPVLELIDTLLTGGPSSRLYKRVVVDAELASSVDGSLLPLADPGLYELSINARRDHTTAEIAAIIDEETARLAREPVTARELAKAKSCAETDFWSGMVGAEGKADGLGHFETAVGDFRALFTTAARLEAATADDVMRVAATYLRPEQRSVVVARPEDDA